MDVESQVGTQAAATLVGYLVQTKVAANLISNQATQEVAAQQVPTATPQPTETPLPPTATPIPPTVPPPPPAPPTEAPAAAAVVSAPAPEISAQVNTNCRQGPSTHYKIDSYLLVGTTAKISGYDPNGWWYIQDPLHTDQYCWVWGGSTTVTGDTSALNVVAASAYAETTNNSGYFGNYYGNTYGYGYNNYGYNYNSCEPVFIEGKVYCVPYPSYCDPYDEDCIYWSGNNNCNWQNAGNYWQDDCNFSWNNCKCNNTWPNNCGKKNNCGNKNTYWSYCLKHPKCCGWQ